MSSVKQLCKKEELVELENCVEVKELSKSLIQAEMEVKQVELNILALELRKVIESINNCTDCIEYIEDEFLKKVGNVDNDTVLQCCTDNDGICCTIDNGICCTIASECKCECVCVCECDSEYFDKPITDGA